MKLPAHRAGLPEKEVSFILCPLTPPTRRGLLGTFRPNEQPMVKMNPWLSYIHEKEGFISSRTGLTIPEDKTSV